MRLDILELHITLISMEFLRTSSDFEDIEAFDFLKIWLRE